MSKTAAALLIWIGNNTALPNAGVDVPEIVVLPQEQLVEVLFRGAVPVDIDLSEVGVDGLYNFDDGKVYLSDDLELNTVEGKAVLLHELVHYLQYHHGLDKRVSCRAELERAAYEAQASFLVDNGKEPPFSQAHILFVSLCPWT